MINTQHELNQLEKELETIREAIESLGKEIKALLERQRDIQNKLKNIV